MADSRKLVFLPGILKTNWNQADSLPKALLCRGTFYMRRISIHIVQFFFVLSLFLSPGCNQQDAVLPKLAPDPSPQIIHGSRVPAGQFKAPVSTEITSIKRIPAGKPLQIPAKKQYQEITSRVVRNGLTIPESTTNHPVGQIMAPPVTSAAMIDTVLARLPKTVRIEGMTSNDINPACITRFGKLQGLDAYNVMSAIQDRQGNIWLAIWNGGITRYDGHHFYTYTKTEGLKDDKVLSLCEDSQGNIWIGYFDQGLTKFDGSRFIHYSSQDGYAENYVSSICEDSSGNLWLGSYEYGITEFDGHQFKHFSRPQGFTDQPVTSIIQDKAGLWIGSKGGGLYIYTNNGFTPVTSPFINDTIFTLHKHQSDLWIGTQRGPVKLSGHDITTFPGTLLSMSAAQSIEEDERGNVWIGTFQDGVYRLTGHQLYQYTEEDGLGDRSVHSIIKDNSGNIWFGTSAGFELFSGELFSHWTTNEGLLQNDVISIAQGKTMRWFGSEDGFTGYDGQYFYQYGASTGIPNTIIFSILEDRKGHLWLGTNTGLVLFNGTQYLTFPQLSDAPVLNIYEDKGGNIWVSGNGATKITYGKSDKKDTFIFYGMAEGLSNDEVKCVVEDAAGNHWIGTDHGLNRLAPDTSPDSSLLYHYSFEQGITNAYITSLYVDQKDQLWIGTFGGGLLKYTHNAGTETIVSYRAANGLISDWVSSIIEDDNHNLWVGGRHGICKINYSATTNPQQENIHFRNYQYINGFLGGSCNMRAISKDPYGDIWIGTRTMATTIHTTGEKIEAQPPTIEITNVQLFGEDVHWRQLSTHPEQRMVLANGIHLDKDYLRGVKKWRNVPDQLSLKYNHNDLTIAFTNITTLQNDQILYQHKLAGLDHNWSAQSPNQEVHFGPIPPGSYTFRLKAVNSEGFWSPEIDFPFVIRPPWWKTWWSYLLYFLLFLTVANALRKYELKRQQLQHSLQLEALKAQTLEELDLLKTKLYTNITHEFRTPLTVILGISDQIRKKLTPGLQDKIELIHRNGWHLLNLVNQMLDLAKIESHQMGLQMIQGNIIIYLRYLLRSFESLASSKGIELTFTDSATEVIMDYDPGKMLQVISNLVSNAIKFTPQGGQVNLTVSKHDENTTEGVPYPELRIEVSDSGIGISPDQLPFIFNRFYQSDNAKTVKGEGTGIGLTLTRELLHLMRGSISVTSEPDKGTHFVIHLPITNTAAFESPAPVTEELTAFRNASLPEFQKNIESSSITNSDKPLLLIIEDNEDIRTFLISCLIQDYTIEIATDGAIGIEKAMALIPDIIITDVMMPVKDGFEVTETLKTSMATSHIPIIILTARTTAEDRIAGLKRGADIYLAKPFYQEELSLHARNLIKLREKLHERYLALKEPPAQQNAESHFEDEFILRLRNIIEDNLDNPDLSIEDICKRLAMSRMQLHRKIKALTNLSTSIFIRNIRLVNARRLLESTGMNVSEVAYAVGFDDPRYFSRVFTDYFGHAPSDLK